jgi:prepilin-type N-terminal cleavage/methylation domain-containing protein
MAKSFSPKRGFTLVEVMVAITVVNVMVALFGRMFVAHNRLVNSLEEWCANDPIYYIQPAADPLARTVAVPAALPLKLPDVGSSLDDVWPNEVELVKLDRDLGNLITRAYVNVSPDPAYEDD